MANAHRVSGPPLFFLCLCPGQTGSCSTSFMPSASRASAVMVLISKQYGLKLPAAFRLSVGGFIGHVFFCNLLFFFFIQTTLYGLFPRLSTAPLCKHTVCGFSLGSFRMFQGFVSETAVTFLSASRCTCSSLTVGCQPQNIISGSQGVPISR